MPRKAQSVGIWLSILVARLCNIPVVPPVSPAYMIAPIAGLSSNIHDLAGRTPALDSAMVFAAQYLVLGAAVLLGILWFQRQGLRACISAGIAVLAAIGLSVVIGTVWDRSRPFVADHFSPLIAHSPDPSFPSDHLAALGAVCAVVWFVSRPLGIVATILCVFTAFARVFVGVHYVSDVAGGFLLGLTCGGLVWLATGQCQPWLQRLDALLVRVRLRPKALTE